MGETIIKPAVHLLCFYSVYPFVYAAVNAPLHAGTVYVTDCIVIAWLSVSDSSAIFLAVRAVICGIVQSLFSLQ